MSGKALMQQVDDHFEDAACDIRNAHHRSGESDSVQSDVIAYGLGAIATAIIGGAKLIAHEIRLHGMRRD